MLRAIPEMIVEGDCLQSGGDFWTMESGGWSCDYYHPMRCIDCGDRFSSYHPEVNDTPMGDACALGLRDRLLIIRRHSADKFGVCPECVADHWVVTMDFYRDTDEAVTVCR